jgi:molybdopterin-containing oxidoreductase family membrane subunit
MNSDATTLTALFRDDRQAAEAIRALASTSWRLRRACGPVQSEPIAEALRIGKTPVGWFTLAGGLIGLLTGYGVASFTALRWSLIVSGKPVVAFVPFLIVGFEVAVLFSVFGTVIGLILQSRLPAYGDLQDHPPECTGERFALLVDCPPEETEELRSFLTERGAWVRPR